MPMCSDSTDELSDGLRAYAYRQCVIIALQAMHTASLWNLPDSSLSWIPPIIAGLVRTDDHNVSNSFVTGSLEPDNDIEDEGVDIEELAEDDYLSDSE